MEELENTTVEEQDNGEGAGEEERRFTQAEVDAIISKRVSAVKRGMPTADELKEFRGWKAQHSSDELQTVTSERDTAQNELEIARRENILLRKGVPADDVDYYVYKISKLVDDEVSFEDAAEKFFKDNKQRASVRMDTGAKFGNGHNSQATANDTMNSLIRGAMK